VRGTDVRAVSQQGPHTHLSKSIRTCISRTVVFVLFCFVLVFLRVFKPYRRRSEFTYELSRTSFRHHLGLDLPFDLNLERELDCDP